MLQLDMYSDGTKGSLKTAYYVSVELLLLLLLLSLLLLLLYNYYK